MASNCKYFDEDAVYRVNRKGLIEFGLVLENAEYVSSDEEDEDFLHVPPWERMKRGHVRVAWHPKGHEEVLSEKKVRLYDRSLMPGDVVRKVIKGKDTQLGYCRNTEVEASVQIVGSKNVIPNVDSKDLKPLEEFAPDVVVFLDSWVGIIQNVKSELTVKFSDGSRCVLMEDDALDLDDIMDRRSDSSEFKKLCFYIGQQLYGPIRCFDKAKWLNVTHETQALLHKPYRNVRVTVEEVKVLYLFVQGVCKAFQDNSSSSSSEQVKHIIEGEDLKRVKMINIFERCALQIGDRHFYNIKENDRILTLEEWKSELSSKYCPQQQDGLVQPSKDTPPPPECGDQPEEQNGVEENDSDFEDVDDDDPNTSDTASVTSVSTASSVERAKPGYFKRGKNGPSLATKVLKKKKLKRARRKVLKEALSYKAGDNVVTETLTTETKAEVVWQDGSVEKNIPSSELYPIHHLDGHEFFPGDFVVENKDSPPTHEYGVVKHVDHSGRTAVITLFKTYMAGADPHPEELGEQEVSVYDIKDHPDFKYRPGSCVIRVANFEDKESASSAGQVVDVHPVGKVEVKWVSGKVSFCYPQELYRIGEYDSDDLWEDEDSCSDEDSWETESEKSLIGVDENAPLENKQDEEKAKGESKSITEDEVQSLREKLQGQIEKLRSGMARLEELFTQNPMLQTSAVMRKLLELYKHCKLLDQLLGTTYFHERHLHSLVERLRQRGRINSTQHVTDQVMRLFSSLDASDDQDSEEPETKVNSDTCATTKPSEPPSVFKFSSIVHLPNMVTEPRNICRQLCTILKCKLLKAHEDVENRFGMSAAQVTDQLQSTSREPSPRHSPNPVPVPVVEPPVELEKSEPSKEVEKQQSIEEVSKNDVPEVPEASTAGQGKFSVMDNVPDSHKYKLSILQPSDPRTFFKMVKKEINLLTTSLPEGIYVKGFGDRMDLYSVLIRGPKKTPYEDGLFLFDFQFPADYPKAPPSCHYISYCSDKLNPNLYEGGKVCVSLLGTWAGKGSEVWSPLTSSLLQVLVSIQGLILVSEPYFNEAGYEQQKGSQQGAENSRMYNEMVVLKLVQAMGKLIQNPPEEFKEEIEEHFRNAAQRFIRRLESWLEISEEWNAQCPVSPVTPEVSRSIASFADNVSLPEFPLVPASRGFCLTLRKTLTNFKQILIAHGLPIS